MAKSNGDAPDPSVVDVMPTKQLFIYMLTLDISLIPAITDFVDNCVDGARRMIAQGIGSFEDYETCLELSRDQFVVFDNCGGIPVAIARDYAFKFGRLPTAKGTKGEFGRFGVGMKRALFKLGRWFSVGSTAPTSSFDLEVDVGEWEKELKWQFRFSDFTENENYPEADWGTTITVEQLYDSIAEEFASETFHADLRAHLASRLRQPLADGYRISVNGVPLSSDPVELLDDPRLAPAFKDLRFPPKGGKPKVRVRLYAGLGKAKSARTARKEAGWYVFCNGRLLLEADKTSATVWGEGDEESIPGFHNQYNAFRGFAYFTADDAGELPWNTTKTGLNQDSEVYRAVRLQMIRLSRPVITFLNKVKDEKERIRQAGGDETGPLARMLEKAVTASVSAVRTRPTFTTPPTPPEPPAPKRPRVGHIQYDRPVEKINAVKKALRVSSYKAVGEGTFDYYYEAECE